MKVFCRREFLNDPLSPSTGSVVAYDGPDAWKPDEQFTFMEVGDCHVRARIHQTTLEGRDQFILKMKLLRTVVDEFISHLGEEQAEDQRLKAEGGKHEAKRSTKCGLGVGCYDAAHFVHGGRGDDGV